MTLGIWLMAEVSSWALEAMVGALGLVLRSLLNFLHPTAIISTEKENIFMIELGMLVIFKRK
jgi:hypothetical protein